MTKEELSQLRKLNNKVKKQQEKLQGMQMRSAIGSPKLDGMPRGSGVSDPTGNAATDRVSLEQDIQSNLAEIQQMRKRIIEYIASIGDDLIRDILYCRHVHCMSWVGVAMTVGGNNTADGVRKTHDRFLANQ